MLVLTRHGPKGCLPTAYSARGREHDHQADVAAESEIACPQLQIFLASAKPIYMYSSRGKNDKEAQLLIFHVAGENGDNGFVWSFFDPPKLLAPFH